MAADSPSSTSSNTAMSQGVRTRQSFTADGRSKLAGYRSFVMRFFRNPQWGTLFLLGRFRFIGNVVVFLRRTPVAPLAPTVQSLFPNVDMRVASSDMERDGLHTNVNLDAATVDEIVKFADSTPCYWSEDPKVMFRHQDRAEAERRVGRSILLGRYFDILQNCPAIHAVTHDPVLKYLATQYLGVEPGQTETRLWWSFASNATAAERVKADQGFHYDLHDFRSIAFFFHLTDVDELSGPHIYVKGSHERKPLRMLLGPTRQCSDAEMIEQYGAANVVSLPGPPGFGFGSDPFGYHKGAPPVKGDRLMLRVRYTIYDDGSRVDLSKSR
jgi:hypothetical protein